MKISGTPSSNSKRDEDEFFSKFSPSTVDAPLLVPLPAAAAATRPPPVVVPGRDVPGTLPLAVRPLTASHLRPARVRVLVGTDVVNGM